MKLIRFGHLGQERPGLIDAQGARRDCGRYAIDYDRVFLDGGGLDRLRRLTAEEIAALPLVPAEARWGAPVARPGKVVCIGLNYADHAAEAGMAIPKEPIVFLKASNTVVGPYDDVLIPRRSLKTDWEVELGVIIGRTARYLDSPADALAHIAGYCVSNDVSEREFQIERGGQWTKGKSCDTFNPLGPWLLTADECGSTGDLAMELDVNGVRKQQGSTRTMIFDVAFIVHYLSQFMTLEAGDVITTGTPPGVGMGRKPQEFLKAGDVMELSIASLGKQRQTCRNA
jgi:2-keto-4-pentenoate hydratase/2-oxohepta-3-ene-1,7-dioic acid hydratase in catechol pathway